jgi:dihydroorotate dehydrogenase (NAD+) catalytic subunit
MDANISVEVFGQVLKTPLILASGILGTSSDLLAKVANNGAGAVTIKSISVEARKGHNNPTVLSWGSGMINAVGYSNPGVEKAAQEFSDISHVKCPVIGSIIGTNAAEFAQVAAEFDKLDFAALEVPLSCPHTPKYGMMGNQNNAEFVAEIVSAICAKTSKPVFVKLPPAATNLVDMALAAKEGGAYGITAVNTVGPAMLIDIESGKPYLGFGFGGISGAALKPLAIAAVFKLYEAVDMPIIGTGGVNTGQDAIEMIMAGATAVGVGTAVSTGGVSVFAKIAEEMRQILHKRGVKSLAEIRGIAHAC